MSHGEDDVEQQLRTQLEEQKEALDAIKDAFAADPSDELEQMAKELQAGIEELQADLLHAAKARLLRSLQPDPAPPSTSSCQHAAQQGARTAPALIPATATVTTPSQAKQQSHFTLYPPPASYDTHTAATQPDSPRPPAGDAWQQPLANHHNHSETAELEQQLRTHLEEQQAALAGIEAALEEAGGESEELSQMAEELRAGIQELQDSLRDLTQQAANGTDHSRAIAHRSSSDMTTGSDNGSSSSSSSSQGSDMEMSEGEEGEAAASGLGSRLDVFSHARLSLAAGIHRDTTHFADWESHTRGIASKLMARMGYVAGRGLGKQGEGIVDPVEAFLMAKQVGLGHHHHKHHHRKRAKDGDVEGGPAAGAVGKKRSRGGEKSRRRKHRLAQAAAREAGRDEEAALETATGDAGVFRFINSSLGDGGAAAAMIKQVETHLVRTDSAKKLWGATGPSRGQPVKPDSRQRLMDQHKRIEACQAKVAHFQAMLGRNKTNSTLAPQIAANLKVAQAELAAAQAEQTRMSGALRAADQNKKSLKF